jgi:hypothetical protein
MRLTMRLDRSFSIRLHIRLVLNLWSILYLGRAAAAEKQCVLQNFGSAKTICCHSSTTAHLITTYSPVPAQLYVEFDGL